MTHRRAVRVVLGAVVALVVLGALGLAALPLVVRPLTTWALAKALKRPVALETADLSLFRGRLTVRGLRVTDHDGQPLATLERLDTAFRPLALLRLRLHVVDGALDGVALRLVRTGPRELNVSDLFGARPERGGGPSVGAIVERFSVRDVAVSLEDRTVTPARTRRFTLEADVRGVSTLAARPPGTAAVRASVDGAPIVVTATDLKLAPLALRATLTVRDLDASIAALALPPASPFTPARGRVHASATLAHDAANGTVVTLEASSKDVA
ncbi:MAG TPA: DUF748 domain-containing protein, partial [Terriglobales bacterium]|nr:DUF748 domain-containing protein [Terriglobales bacterium]